MAIARRTSVSCHFGIRNASNSRLTVEAKVEKDMENLMGLIHGFTVTVPAGTNIANAAKTGTASKKCPAQPGKHGISGIQFTKKAADGRGRQSLYNCTREPSQIVACARSLNARSRRF